MRLIKIKVSFFMLALIGMVIVSCDFLTPKWAEELDNPLDPVSSKAISAFTFTTPSAAGVIDEVSHTIAVTVPYGTSLTSLKPTITHNGESVSPASGVAQNFSSAKTYTVTAADASTKTYTVTVTAASSTAKAITAFSFGATSSAGIIDETNHTVAVTVPYGTDASALIPTISHTGASISPASGVSQDFGSAKTYTVTAADGSTQAYIVTVAVLSVAVKSINSFSFVGIAGSGVITESTHTIAITVPFGTSVLALTPTINYSGSSISPSLGSAQNFTNPVTYAVTAADTSIQTYTVTVTVALNPAKAITVFTFPTSTSITISEASHTISITVPYGTDVTTLVPTISHTGASVSPASGVVRNFTSSQTYTVTAADGTSQDYTVTVSIAPNPVKAITAFNLTAPFAVGAITESTHSIEITLPYGTLIKRLVPTINFSGSTVSPASGVAKDFTNPVTYTVTAADGTTQSYLVSVKYTTFSDFNGDGYSDVIVGAPYYSSNTGRAYIYMGSSSMDNIVDIVMTGEAGADIFGLSIASAGDVNGDGYCDAIVGASYNDAGGENTGRAYIYFGGISMDNIPDVIITGSVVGDCLGLSVDSAGDVNADGFSDVIATTYYADSNAGRAYIYYGGSSMDDVADIIFYGENANDNFGLAVAHAGDVNCDGYSDVIIGAGPYNNVGRAYIYFGGLSMNSVPDIIMTGSIANGSFGINVSSAGDVNADGFSDVVVGAISADYAYIFYGGSSMNNSVDLMLASGSGDYYGYSVASIGDVNNDGYSDILIGAPYNDASGLNAGKAYIYYGDTAMNSSADITMVGDVAGGQLGYSVAYAGDVNGDGYDDIIIGAPLVDKVYIYFGGTIMNSAADLILSGASGSYFGQSVY